MQNDFFSTLLAEPTPRNPRATSFLSEVHQRLLRRHQLFVRLSNETAQVVEGLHHRTSLSIDVTLPLSKVKAGERFFAFAGLVHAGAGLLQPRSPLRLATPPLLALPIPLYRIVVIIKTQIDASLLSWLGLGRLEVFRELRALVLDRFIFILEDLVLGDFSDLDTLRLVLFPALFLLACHLAERLRRAEHRYRHQDHGENDTSPHTFPQFEEILANEIRLPA